MCAIHSFFYDVPDAAFSHKFFHFITVQIRSIAAGIQNCIASVMKYISQCTTKQELFMFKLNSSIEEDLIVPASRIFTQAHS